MKVIFLLFFFNPCLLFSQYELDSMTLLFGKVICEINENAKPKEANWRALAEEIQANIQYPENLLPLELEYRLFVFFSVRKDGSISRFTCSSNVPYEFLKEVDSLNQKDFFLPMKEGNITFKSTTICMSVLFYTERKLKSPKEMGWKEPIEQIEFENDEIVGVRPLDAEFPGGIFALKEFFGFNSIYPEEAEKNHEEGVVYVGFFVDTNGVISQIEIRRGVSKTLDLEAIRLVKLMPNWIPGEMDGKKEKMKVILPITFTLD